MSVANQSTFQNQSNQQVVNGQKSINLEAAIITAVDRLQDYVLSLNLPCLKEDNVKQTAILKLESLHKVEYLIGWLSTYEETVKSREDLLIATSRVIQDLEIHLNEIQPNVLQDFASYLAYFIGIYRTYYKPKN